MSVIAIPRGQLATRGASPSQPLRRRVPVQRSRVSVLVIDPTTGWRSPLSSRGATWGGQGRRPPQKKGPAVPCVTLQAVGENVGFGRSQGPHDAWAHASRLCTLGPRRPDPTRRATSRLREGWTGACREQTSHGGSGHDRDAMRSHGNASAEMK